MQEGYCDRLIRFEHLYIETLNARAMKTRLRVNEPVQSEMHDASARNTRATRRITSDARVRQHVGWLDCARARIPHNADVLRNFARPRGTDLLAHEYGAGDDRNNGTVYVKRKANANVWLASVDWLNPVVALANRCVRISANTCVQTSIVFLYGIWA